MVAVTASYEVSAQPQGRGGLPFGMTTERKLLDGARQHLEPGEQIVAAVPGSYETKIMGSDSVRSGILIATDRRVLFYAKKLTGYDLESYPYTSVSSIDQGKNMMGHKVTFYASGNKIEVKWIKDLKALERFMNTAKVNIHARTTALRPQAPTPPPLRLDAPSPSSSTESVMAQLRGLGELRDAGILTEEEFSAKKAELLKRL